MQEEFSPSDFPFEHPENLDQAEDSSASFTQEEYKILGDYEGFDYEEDEDTIAMNKAFLLSFECGEEMLEYIKTGDQKEVLNKIQKPMDLLEYAKERNLEIQKRFIYDGYNLDVVLEAFMYEQNEIKKQEEDELGRVLRVMNLLLRICQEKMIYDHVRYYTNKYKLCSLEEFKSLNKDFIQLK